MLRVLLATSLQASSVSEMNRALKQMEIPISHRQRLCMGLNNPEGEELSKGPTEGCMHTLLKGYHPRRTHVLNWRRNWPMRSLPTSLHFGVPGAPKTKLASFSFLGQ